MLCREQTGDAIERASHSRKFQNNDEKQHHDLAVEAGLAEIAAPTPEAQVDEGVKDQISSISTKRLSRPA